MKGTRLRFSLRAKLGLVALVLLALPWAGALYVNEVERFLLEGQEQTLLATARAVATALHERPHLLRPEREATLRTALSRTARGRIAGTPLRHRIGGCDAPGRACSRERRRGGRNRRHRHAFQR